MFLHLLDKREGDLAYIFFINLCNVIFSLDIQEEPFAVTKEKIRSLSDKIIQLKASRPRIFWWLFFAFHLKKYDVINGRKPDLPAYFHERGVL